MSLDDRIWALRLFYSIAVIVLSVFAGQVVASVFLNDAPPAKERPPVERPVRAAPAVPPVAVPTTPEIFLVNGNRVNFRAGPGTNYQSLGQYNRGAEMEKIGGNANWVHLKDRSSGAQGWIAAYLLTRKPGISPQAGGAPAVPASGPAVQTSQ